MPRSRRGLRPDEHSCPDAPGARGGRAGRFATGGSVRWPLRDVVSLPSRFHLLRTPFAKISEKSGEGTAMVRRGYGVNFFVLLEACLWGSAQGCFFAGDKKPGQEVSGRAGKGLDATLVLE